MERGCKTDMIYGSQFMFWYNLSTIYETDIVMHVIIYQLQTVFSFRILQYLSHH